ncbi:MAG: hypothetical protein M3Q63_00950 [bacterium]|nr:hypothetical protein [bacterium]
MIKKTLIIAIIFFVIALLVGSYFLFFNRSSPEAENSDSEFPFGGLSGDNPLTNSPEISSTDTSLGENIIPVTPLMNLSRLPIAGTHVSKVSTSTLVRYNIRASGHTYEVNLNAGTTSKLTNTTIPRIQESFWLSNGTRTLLRYVNETGDGITTYNAEITKKLLASPTEVGELTGKFMTENITNLAVSPDSKRFFFITESEMGAQGYVTDAVNDTQTQIFSFPVSEWITQWPTQDTITVTTKPSSRIDGYVYSLNTKTRVFKKMLGGVLGLTTLTNPTAEYIAYADNQLNLSIFDVKSQTSSPTNVKTLPEKCVWSKKDTTILYCAVSTKAVYGTLPDSWYQGKVTFQDEFYKIDTKNKQFDAVSLLEKTHNQKMDIINPILSAQDDYIIFTNRNNGTLWSLEINR